MWKSFTSGDTESDSANFIINELFHKESSTDSHDIFSYLLQFAKNTLMLQNILYGFLWRMKKDARQLLPVSISLELN